MDIQKEREAFEEWAAYNGMGLYVFESLNKYAHVDTEAAWQAWQAAKAESHKSASLYQFEINHLAAANQQWRDYAAKAQVVPEGFVVVPKQPTPKMIDATWNFDEEIQDMSHNSRNEFIYNAMIEAAQEPAND